MVNLTDRFVGETHAIKVDVRGSDGGQVSALQCHESFRRCVGQSCAEFAIDLLARREGEETGTGTAVGERPKARKDSRNGEEERKEAPWQPGVYLPEDLYRDAGGRKLLLRRMTATPGTFAYEYNVGTGRDGGR